MPSLRLCCSPSSHFWDKGCPEAGVSGGHVQVHMKVLRAGEDSEHPQGSRSRSPSSWEHQAPAKKHKEQMKLNSAYQSNTTSFFTRLSPNRLLAGTEALVQLCPDKRRTGTALVKLLLLLTEEKLSAKMPAAMPSYPADPGWGFHTVNLLL